LCASCFCFKSPLRLGTFPNCCSIAFSGERVANVSLLFPRDSLDLLDEAARRFGLDALGLRATTQAALAVPDHIVTVEVDPVKQPGSEAPF
jgi:hypothetical protein